MAFDSSIVSIFLSFFLLIQVACLPFESSSSSTAFVTRTTTSWRAAKNHHHLDSFSVNGSTKRRCLHSKNKMTTALCSTSRSSMDETYEALAKHAIEKLNLVRKQQQQQQQDNDNTNNARPHQRHRRRRLWIGLAGGPGSGKSTVADAVAERINKIMDNNVSVSALVLPMDGFHYTQAYLKEHNMDMKRRGAPWTFDAKTMYEKLHDVTAHHSNDHNSDDADQQQQDPTSFWFPLYNRDISDPVENAICINDSHDIIIVEGLYMLFGALGEQAQDPESPLMQTIQKKFPAGKWPSSPEQHPTLFCSIQEEIAKWKPITELLDETWYVEAPGGLPEQEQRLIQRSLQTWTSAKTKLWGGGDDDDTKVTAEQAATNRVQYNDTPNGQLIECCRPYADRVIETR